MLWIVHTSGVVSFVMYTVAAAFFLATTVLRRSTRLTAIGMGSAVAAFILQTIALVGIAFHFGFESLVGDEGDYYFLFSWALALSFLIGSLRFSFPIVGAFVLPAVLFALGGSSYVMHLSEGTADSSGVHPLILFLHIIPALCAEVSLFFAFVVSAVYLGHERAIRQKSLDDFSLRGPSLERLDFLQGRFVLVGFIAMSFAVLSGVVWGVSREVSFVSGDFSQWASIVAWGLLGFILFLRRGATWSPRRVSRLTAVVAGCYFVGLVLVGIFGGGVLHAFGRLS